MRRRRPLIPRRVLRPLIKAAAQPGLSGMLGRYCGQALGWPLDCGYRIGIEDPREWIQRQIIDTCTYEPSVSALIDALLGPDDLFLDVGANFGYHTLVAAAAGARVHAFEPVPRLRTRLENNIRRNRLVERVTVSEVALGASNGTAPFYLASRVDDGSHSLIAGVPADSIEEITVPTRRLDDYLTATGSEPPTLVKIDVEGAEALVLDGASALLDGPRAPTMIVETADRLADLLGESASSVLARLFRRDYRVWSIPDAAGPPREVRLSEITGHLANYLASPPGSPLLGRVPGLERTRAPSC